MLSVKSVLGLDTESTGLNPRDSRLLLIQIGDPQVQYVYNALTLDKRQLTPLLNLIQDQDKTFVLQNAAHDYKFFKYNYNIEPSKIRDTLLIEQTSRSGQLNLKYSLDHIIDRLLYASLPKETRKMFIDRKLDTPFSLEEIEYAGRDVEYLIPVYSKLLEIIEQKKITEVCLLECETSKVTGELELNGFHLSSEKWLEALTIAQENYKEKREIFIRYFEVGDEVNIDSHKQVRELLSDKLGHDIPFTSEQFLKTQPHHEAIDILSDYRHATKRLTTYGHEFLKKFWNKETGRIYPSFNQCGPNTGRYSCSNPNLQNIPQEILYRNAFTAPEGYKIITADYKSMELVLLAEVSQDEEFCKAVHQGLDLHRVVASIIYQKPYASITASERKVGKALNFGITYGKSAYQLGIDIDCSTDQAQSIINEFYKRFPKIYQLLTHLETRALETGFAYSPLDGRQRYLPEDPYYPRELRHIKNVARNMPFQGGCASCLKNSLCLIREQIKSYDARLVNQVHDEIIIEAHVNCADEISEIVRSSMIAGAKYYVKTVPVAVDIIVQESWTKG